MDVTGILLGIVVGLVPGALVGWFLGVGRLSRQFQQHTVELSARAERAESLEAELRRQLEQDRLEGGQLRADLATAQQARASAEVRTEEALKHVAEQKQLVEQSRQQLLESFQALSNDALTKNNQAFLNLARVSFETLQAKAEGELSQRQQAIDGLVKPLHDSLQRYDEQMRLLEQSRQSAYGGLDQHLKSLAESHQRLQQETGNLVKALRAPTVRGQWGEITLKRVAELAGMVDHCDFFEQESVTGEDRRFRPDMVVRLPGGRQIIVDAKTGKWEKKSQLSEKLPDGAMFSVDFNPAADRMRVIGSDGTSLRVNVDDGKATVDGKLKYAESDAAKGAVPKVTAVAYTNSFAGTKETALYDIDAMAGALVKQAPPNDGILNTVGKLGVKIDGAVAFDIWSDGKGGNTAWLVSGNTLHSVDLATGTAKAMGAISGLKGRTMDIAILPAM